MKKIIYSSLLTLTLNIGAFAQAVLPTSCTFSPTTLPTGWSETNVNSATPPYYTASGNPAPAYKMDATGDLMQIAFSTTPGTFTYDLAGNSFSGGTFKVQESANGTTWTDMRTITASPGASGAYVTYTDNPNSASRFVRFNYVNKSAGNIGVDNVTLNAGVSANQEILVKQGGVAYTNGSTFTTASAVGVLSTVTFSIFDLGLTALNISNITITGSAASDYVVGTFPNSVAATSSANFNVDFTPSAAGTRSAVMTITSNDPLNGSYVINLYGIGGNLATEPTAQASNMTFPIVKSYRLKVQYTAASPSPDGYIVLRSNTPITDVPVDGVAYLRGDRINNAQVVMCSNSNYFFPNNIIANTTYHFAVFAYNGIGQYRNYLTNAPLTGSITSAGNMQASNYYNGIATTNSTLVTDIHTKINPHTVQFYGSYGPLMMDKFYARDTANDQRVATCVYSGFNQVYTGLWDWTANNFNREHTYPQSWMPTVNSTSPAFNTLPEYSDYHMLTPANSQPNSLRSNYPLGVVTGSVTASFGGCKLGVDANNHRVFEPRDSDKGDAARAMLYQCVAYTGVPYSGPANTNAQRNASWALPFFISGSINYAQDQNVLKLWNTQDPPDNFEIAHNDYVDSLQGNRNPFIDHPEFVCYINFDSMSYNATGLCVPLGIAENATYNSKITVSPNPSNGAFVLSYNAIKNQNAQVRIFDITGRMVYNKDLKMNAGFNSMDINIAGLSKGIYTLQILAENERQTQKLVIE
jgi:endonuclease I